MKTPPPLACAALPVMVLSLIVVALVAVSALSSKTPPPSPTAVLSTMVLLRITRVTALGILVAEAAAVGAAEVAGEGAVGDGDAADDGAARCCRRCRCRRRGRVMAMLPLDEGALDGQGGALQTLPICDARRARCRRPG